LIEKLLDAKLGLINNIHALLLLNLVLLEEFIENLMEFLLVNKRGSFKLVRSTQLMFMRLNNNWVECLMIVDDLKIEC
jgi:hypothetical protein